MSKPVKKLVKDELVRRFEGLASMVVVGFTGVDGVATNKIRRRLGEKDIKLTVVKNALARQAFDAVGIPDAKGLLHGPCAVAFGLDPGNVGAIEIVRELLDIRRQTPELTVKAAVLEGETFGTERIKELSNYPTREEAIQKALACLLSPGRRLAGCLLGPGRVIAGLLRAIQEKAESEALRKANKPPDEET